MAQEKYSFALENLEELIQSYAQIPVFNQTTNDKQNKLNKIVNNFTMHDSAAAIDFGAPVIRKDSNIQENASKILKNINFLSIARPVSNASAYMESLDVPSLQNRAKTIINKGDNVIQAGFLKKTFSYAVSIISEEKAEKMRAPDSIIRIQYEMSSALASFNPFMREIEISALGLPNLEKTAKEQFEDTLEILPDLALYISAGNKILENYHEKALPEARQKNDLSLYHKLESNAENLKSALLLLDKTHGSAISCARILGVTISTIKKTIETVSSILNKEADDFKETLYTSCNMLQKLESINLIKSFSQSAQKTITEAEKKLRDMEKMMKSKDTKPEQIQTALEDWAQTEKNLKAAAELLPKLEKMQNDLSNQLLKTSNDFMNKQVSSAGKVLEFANK